ncbi:hypothetical protein C8T65DRAFT_70347 [Cerioporus squamosus]|nr:hypothetical protein C8T65DRAFT_70347 [Cerioporus squamosus]
MHGDVRHDTRSQGQGRDPGFTAGIVYRCAGTRGRVRGACHGRLQLAAGALLLGSWVTGVLLPPALRPPCARLMHAPDQTRKRSSSTNDHIRWERWSWSLRRLPTRLTGYVSEPRNRNTSLRRSERVRSLRSAGPNLKRPLYSERRPGPVNTPRRSRSCARARASASVVTTAAGGGALTCAFIIITMHHGIQRAVQTLCTAHASARASTLCYIHCGAALRSPAFGYSHLLWLEVPG